MPDGGMAREAVTLRDNHLMVQIKAGSVEAFGELTGRRGPLLRPAIAALVSEGVLVVTNRGNCPLGPLGDAFGDPAPLFDLVLSPRGARRAIPTLGVLTAVGLGLLAARSRTVPTGRSAGVAAHHKWEPDPQRKRRVEANGE